MRGTPDPPGARYERDDHDEPTRVLTEPAPDADSDQTFMVDVRVRTDGVERRALARGRDIYAVSAPLAVEAARRILAGVSRSAAQLQGRTVGPDGPYGTQGSSNPRSLRCVRDSEARG